MLLRISELVAVAPEIQELDLNPVIVRTAGACVADVRVRVDEPGDHDVALRIDHARAIGGQVAPDVQDAVALDEDIGLRQLPQGVVLGEDDGDRLAVDQEAVRAELARLTEYIEEHLDQRLSLARIARATSSATSPGSTGAPGR